MKDDRPRIDGKFYPLQNDEWLQACKELKPAELKVLYHLRTLTPFGDRSVELGVTEIALQLGMSKSTVSEGLKALSQKGWIDLELIKVKVRLKTVRHSEHCSPQRTAFATANPSSPQRTPVRHSEQSESETLSGQGFSLSKIYIDFKDSLSEGEREKFFDFVRQEIKNFTRPINDLEAWLASETKAGEKRWLVYYEKFKEREKRALSRPSLSQEIEEKRQRILAEERAEEEKAKEERARSEAMT